MTVSACGSATPPEPDDVDLSAVRTAFRCGQGAAADAAACHALDAFLAAGPVRDWPTGSDVQVWLGADHCVSPTTSGTHAAYQLVYLREGPGTAPLGTVAPARVLSRSAVFASSQIDTSSMPAEAAALAAIARGETPDASTTGELWRVIPESPEGAESANVYRTLVSALSGISVGDGDASTGMWFLRSDGTHLLLVSPSIQGGCASELSRVRR